MLRCLVWEAQSTSEVENPVHLPDNGSSGHQPCHRPTNANAAAMTSGKDKDTEQHAKSAIHRGEGSTVSRPR